MSIDFKNRSNSKSNSQENSSYSVRSRHYVKNEDLNNLKSYFSQQKDNSDKRFRNVSDFINKTNLKLIHFLPILGLR